MNKIKLQIVIPLILLLVVSNSSFGQDEDPPPCGNEGPEVWIYNFTSQNISVKVYPVSMVFNTHEVSPGVFTYKYDLKARMATQPNERSKFIGATNKIRKGSPFIGGIYFSHFKNFEIYLNRFTL